MSKDDLMMINLIKLYILFNPRCTAREISRFFSGHGFTVMTEYTPMEVSKLIRYYSSPSCNVTYKWFDGLVVEKRGNLKYYSFHEE